MTTTELQEPNALTTGAFIDANGILRGSYYGKYAGFHFGEFGSLRAAPLPLAARGSE